MAGGELIGPVLQGTFIALFLLVTGSWSLSSLITMKRWLLVLASLGGGVLSWLAGRQEGADVLTVLQWLLTSAVVARLYVAVERAIAEGREQ